MFDQLKLSPGRARDISEQIQEGSSPQGRFYVLLILATLIASFGLLANSTAVVIGAMLVSPLMTPIFGMALGLLRGETELFWNGIRAESVGIILAIAFSCALGFITTNPEATPEMMARTKPNLMDLMVAICSGLAGAYALLDEKVSPALPGVAIATAIVPPLATVGLCLSIGAFEGALGAMLLFLANLVSILLVAVFVFSLGGFAPKFRERTARSLVKDFGPTVIAFLAIAVILTQSFVQIVEDRHLTKGIQTVLKEEFSKVNGLELVRFKYSTKGDIHQIMVTIRSAESISPSYVSKLEERLTDRLDAPIELVLRAQMTQDIAATGSDLHIVRPNLDGKLFRRGVVRQAEKQQLAIQIFREYFQDEAGFELGGVELGTRPNGQQIVLAKIGLVRRLLASDVAQLEATLRQRLQNPEIGLALQYSDSKFFYDNQFVDLNWSNGSEATQQELAEMPKWEQQITEKLKLTPLIRPVSIYMNKKDETWRVLILVVGPYPLTPTQVSTYEIELARELGEKFVLYFRHQHDYVVSAEKILSYEELVAPESKRQREHVRALFKPTDAP